ncbi:Multiple epidermal growth factor-like domains protein 6 isoform X1 [Oopsacas minuta]|uniref:Multiple epidermal growth factor-like domains protein 6 isoform X1 n=1 Tax=Oopsacas minuta TaxID=111878 RepID=A0AAV7JX27_9METZ|nr:Multiple epidermal growth factor-like domains protein 6 isoform X1 [Oopsacas minuta]
MEELSVFSMLYNCYMFIGTILLVFNSILVHSQSCEELPFILQIQEATNNLCSPSNQNITESEICFIKLNDTSYECACKVNTETILEGISYTFQFTNSCLTNQTIINPCESSCGNGTCSQNGLNTVCICNNGFELANDNCVDIDECTGNISLCEHNCHNTVGSYSCSCRDGYTIRDGIFCEDIDECSTVSPSPCDQICSNILGSYECDCNSGYIIDNTGNCSDINECEDMTHSCREDQLCINQLGGFECVCKKGFGNNRDLQKCLDIDECQYERNFTIWQNLTGLPNICEQLCVNMIGRVECDCTTGYSLDNNNYNCSDIDECSQEICAHNCSNNIASFTCSCMSGYVLDSNQRDCEDINECNITPKVCNQICINKNGSYECECESGFVLATANECIAIDNSLSVAAIIIIGITIVVLITIAVVSIIAIVLAVFVS